MISGKGDLGNMCSDALLQDMVSSAWAAGFVDGEGCIHIIRQKYGTKGMVTYKLRMHIAQANLEVLQRLREVIGEHGVIHTLRRKIATNKQVYSLNYDSSHALRAITKIQPYLVRKLYEAEAAQSFWTEGNMNLRTGPKPVPEEFIVIREKWCRKMQKLK